MSGGLCADSATDTRVSEQARVGSEVAGHDRDSGLAIGLCPARMRGMAPLPAGSRSNTIEIVRLAPHARRAIQHGTAKVAGPAARALLFGSHTDDCARGAVGALVTR